DTVLEFRGHWNLLPKNYVGVEKGQWLNVKCISNGIARHPLWLVQNSSLVSTEKSIDNSTDQFINILKISNASEEHNGDYRCFVEGYRQTVFKVQVINPTENYSSKIVVGHSTLTCLSNGQWSDNAPRCESVSGCPRPLKTEDIELLVEPDKDFYRFGESITLACNPGFVLSSEVIRPMCLGSTWSETNLPHCLRH
ncbi:protein lev-9, partial [Caerostris darwini]